MWLIALVGALKGHLIALWPLWFLALAKVLNLIAHPILALRAGGYFPGLLTAPVVGLLGILAVRELLRVTTAGAAARPGIAADPHSFAADRYGARFY